MKHPSNAIMATSIVLVAFGCTWLLITDLPEKAPSNPERKATTLVMDTTAQAATSKSQMIGRRSSRTERSQGSNLTNTTVAPSDAEKKPDPRLQSRPQSKPTDSALKHLDIPKICTTDLPGLEFNDHKQALEELSSLIRSQSTRQVQRLRPGPHPFRPLNSVLDDKANSSSSNPMLNENQDASGRMGAVTGRPIGSRQNGEVPNPPFAEVNRELSQAAFNPHQQFSGTQNAKYLAAAADPHCDPHAEVFSRTAFPSATQCKSCHEQIYQEWSVSAHAYASVSPMFHKFEQKINTLSQGTIGYFCMRCHAPVATTMELRRDQPIWDGPRVFREGVTCVACHRVVQAHGKDNGERRVEPGSIVEPIVGSSNGVGVEIAKKYKDHFKVKTDLQDRNPGQFIHRRAIQFDQLSKSSFCVSCHQVAVEPGIALEVVWAQYRASPAYRQGISCQDCHMGRVPGLPEGYSVGPVAVIEGKQVTPERKHSNHQFYGPGYSIAHPGVFPQNPDADKWTFNEWLQFDWRSGWGTEAFEEAVQNGQTFDYFPHCWSEADDRMDAREIIDANLRLLNYKRDLRRQVMENGAKIEGPFFAQTPRLGRALKLHYLVKNINTGHNMPSGSLGAQPQLWLNLVLIGPRGNRLWESGYLDSIGDLADQHSADVLARRVPLDSQLFNLQTKFLTTNVKGTEREMYLPINVDIDQLPFIRPDARPNTVMNHPPFIRMEGHSIPATGSRRAKYKIPGRLLREPGCYRLSVRMRSRAEPIYFMKFVGATPEMIRSMNEGILDVHTYSKVFTIR